MVTIPQTWISDFGTPEPYTDEEPIRRLVPPRTSRRRAIEQVRPRYPRFLMTKFLMSRRGLQAPLRFGGGGDPTGKSNSATDRLGVWYPSPSTIFAENRTLVPPEVSLAAIERFGVWYPSTIPPRRVETRFSFPFLRQLYPVPAACRSPRKIGPWYPQSCRCA